MRLIFLFLPIAGALAAQTAGSSMVVAAIDSATKLPIPDVSVRVLSAEYVSGKTDRAGVVTFEDIAPGSHRIGLTRQGYNDTMADLRVRPGGAAERFTVAMDALGAISGAVVDEDDAPLAGVAIYIGTNLRSTTDQQGRYELEYLLPGDYRITLRTPYELRKKTLKVDAQSGEPLGFASTEYYPGVTDRTLAETITLPAGSFLTGLKIRLRRTRLVALQGRLVDGADGGILHPAALELVSSPASLETSAVGEHGEFSFDLVQPGHYSLVISGARSKSDLPYSVPLDLGEAGATDKEIRVPPFPQLSVIVKATDPNIQLTGRCEITLAETSDGRTVAGSGTAFAVGEVPPGNFRLSAKVNGLHAADDPARKFYVDSIRFGQEDGFGREITVVEGGNPPIELIVTDQSGQVSGTVMDDEPGGMVFVTARRAGSSAAGLAPNTMTRSDGSFTIAGLVADDYEVVAWPGNRVCAGANCPCNDQAAKVTVVNGQTAVVRLRACH
jgi:hypothetical protein